MGMDVDMLGKQIESLLIEGVSYIGSPKSNTAVFVTRKAAFLLEHLQDTENCLVFVENGISVPKEIKHLHMFLFCDNPQAEYAYFAAKLYEKKAQMQRRMKYTLHSGGYYLGEGVTFGRNAYIEPGCMIGHGVSIGDDAVILSGAIIKNAKIGNGFLCNENAVVGAKGFTVAKDREGNQMRIPTMGRVVIGDYVEIGTLDNISCGSGGDTVIGDHVKLDTMVHIGHDAFLHRNVEVTACSIIGGYTEIGENAFIGLNATIRNRIKVGRNARVSMGAVVTKDVRESQTVTGNFAVEHGRFIRELKESNARNVAFQDIEIDKIGCADSLGGYCLRVKSVFPCAKEAA